jgi:hypothetical protein
MGAGPKRGRTYSWLFDHLADAFGETSPRSFITALQKAANHSPAPAETAIDHNGIRAGVQDASEIRVAQLKEDYDWITSVLQALEDLEVPYLGFSRSAGLSVRPYHKLEHIRPPRTICCRWSWREAKETPRGRYFWR